MLTALIRAMTGDQDTPNEVLIDAMKDEGVEVATVYVVRGTCGVHMDTQTWDVAAFLDEEAAGSLCTRLNIWCESRGAHTSRLVFGQLAGGPVFDPPEEDPGFRSDFGGTRYAVENIRLRG